MPQKGRDTPATDRQKVDKERSANYKAAIDTGPRSDDTGYISPYRARLKKIAAMGNTLDSRGQRVSTLSQTRIEQSRSQLADIHSRTRKKDGGRRTP